MALIDCPECGQEVSSSAAACPVCAYPVTPSGPLRPADPTVKTPWMWWSILLRVVAGVFLLAGAAEEESVAGVIGALIIGGSAIPTWYRGKIERLKAGRGATGLDDRLEDRLVALEQRHQDHMARLERAQTGQIAELEERIDFTERVLTKQRDLDLPG